METEGSVDTQKAAYDAVHGQEKIRERDIKMLISQYGKLLGKDRTRSWYVSEPAHHGRRCGDV